MSFNLESWVRLHFNTFPKEIISLSSLWIFCILCPCRYYECNPVQFLSKGWLWRMPFTEDCLEYNAVWSSLTASTFSSWFLSDHQIAANWGLHTVVSCWFHFTREDEWQLKAWSSGNFELCVEKENTQLSRWWREVPTQAHEALTWMCLPINERPNRDERKS